MTPQCIDDLCLEEVFRTYSSKVQQFIIVSDKDEHIVDSFSAGKCVFVAESIGMDENDAQKHFEVKNPSGNEYALIQIDNGIIRRKAPVKRCDCAISNDKELCFIEFKTNVISANEKVQTSNYMDAIIQLSTTIKLVLSGLQSLGKDLLSIRNVEAYICFRKGYPSTTSTQMDYKVSFAKSNNGIPLSFARSKSL